MREIDSIIVHCSASGFGDVHTIDQWHKERGWDGVGYHLVITNGVFQARGLYRADHDGLMQNGRDILKPGAHCRGKNKTSVGICLIGCHHFSAKQLYEALPNALHYYMREYALDEKQIFGHRDFNARKTCPNIDTHLIRRLANGLMIDD